MVLAKTRYVYVTDNDHLFMVFGENSIIDDIYNSSSVERWMQYKDGPHLLIVLRILESSTSEPAYTVLAFGQDPPYQDLHLCTQE